MPTSDKYIHSKPVDENVNINIFFFATFQKLT